MENFDCSDAQYNSFVESAKWNYTKELNAEGIEAEELDAEEIETDGIDLKLKMAIEKYGDFDRIKAGFIRWQEHAVYERKCMENNHFVRILAMGLQGVSRATLENVHLRES